MRHLKAHKASGYGFKEREGERAVIENKINDIFRTESIKYHSVFPYDWAGQNFVEKNKNRVQYSRHIIEDF